MTVFGIGIVQIAITDPSVHLFLSYLPYSRLTAYDRKFPLLHGSVSRLTASREKLGLFKNYILLSIIFPYSTDQ